MSTIESRSASDSGNGEEDIRVERGLRGSPGPAADGYPGAKIVFDRLQAFAVGPNLRDGSDLLVSADILI